MEYEVVWTQSAGLQLEEIRDFIGADNPSAAQRVVEKIVKRVDQLAHTPRIGAVYRRSAKHTVRKIVSGKYRVFYRINEDDKRVEILLIWHGARQDPDLGKLAKD